MHKTHKTYMAKTNELAKKCYLIDAKDKILGRVATQCAVLLRGKNKPQFTPNVDTGDVVVVINADKIRVTGKKLNDKVYLRYTGYSSGQRRVRLEEMLKKQPTQVIQLAVNRMIPSGRLGNAIRKKLRVYAGDKHPHAAQKPISVEI